MGEYVYDGDDEQHWVAGIVSQVKDDTDGVTNIIVHIQDDDGDWVLPSTIKARNQYHSKFILSHYITHAKQDKLSLPQAQALEQYK